MSPRVKGYGVLVLLIGIGLVVHYRNDLGLVSTEEGSAKASTKAVGKKATKKAESKDEVVPVELAEAGRGSISSYLSSTANLRARRDVEITTQADGVAEKLLVEEGDFVEQGQLLCELDDRELQINLTLNRQQLAQAKLQLEKSGIQREKTAVQIENTKVELNRKETAFKEQLVSEQEVDQLRYTLEEQEHDERVASSDVRELTHRVEELDATIEQGELEVSRTQIRAPFAGYITERRVELGQMVRSLERLFRLASFSPLYADVYLSEQETHQIRPGQPARVMLGATERGQTGGRVLRISPVVDESTGTVKVTVELTGAAKDYRPGAFVRVDIETDTHADTVLIPKRAIVEEDGEHYVFTTDGATANRRKVDLGYESDAQVEVRKGVVAGDRVVVAGQGNLKEGSKVREVDTSQPTASPEADVVRS